MKKTLESSEEQIFEGTKMDKIRYIALINFFICVILGGVSFYYNAIEAVPLCPLCSVQLVCYYIIGVLSLIRFVYLPERAGRYGYAAVVILFAIIGIVFGGRQLWMQHLPNASSLPCSPDIIDELGHFGRFLGSIFRVYNDCALANWSFIGMSMVTWSIIFFAILILSAISLIFTAPYEKEDGE